MAAVERAGGYGGSVPEDTSATGADAGAATSGADAATSTDAAGAAPDAGTGTGETPATVDAAAGADSTLESPASAAGGAPADAGSTGGVPGAEPATSTDASAGTGAPSADAAAGAGTTESAAAAGAAPLDAAPAPDAAAGAPPADAGAAAPAAGAPLKSDRIQLVGESGQTLSLGVRTPVGKHTVRQFGDDANVWDTEQLVIERGPDGGWQVVPEAGTTNETLLNGAPITGPQPLHDGDVIAVGRAEKGISRLPLTVRGA